MDNLTEMFVLLARGQIPPEACAAEYKPPPVESAFRAAYHVMRKGAEFPLDLTVVGKIAIAQYQGTDDTLQFLEEAGTAQSGVVLESVQQSMVLRHLQDLVTEQLGTGQFDFDRLRQLLDVPVDKSDHVALVSSPSEDEFVTDFLVIPQWPRKILRYFGGFKDELVYVAARPKHGKSTFFANLIWATPQYRTVYVTVADYGRKDFEKILYRTDPAIVNRDNLWIVDYTAAAVGVRDVEGVVQELKPELVIVDRSEKMYPLGKVQRGTGGYDPGLVDIADGLRRLAKRYTVPVLTDSQLADRELRQDGVYETMDDHRITFSRMAADRTGRAAILDLFLGLHRVDHGVYISVEGRRQGYPLPGIVHVVTDDFGRYQWAEKTPQQQSRQEEW